MELILAAIGLLLSFFFAGSETAFISTNKIRFQIWVHQKQKSALKAKPYFENPDLFLSTTLVGNNIANVLATSFATAALIVFFSETATWAIITFTLLLFGELLPKIIFRTHANRLILSLMPLIRLSHFLLNPVIRMVNSLSNFFLHLLGISHHHEKYMFSKDDVEILMREGKVSGVVDEDEHRIIKKVLDLPEIMVREAMIPRTEILALEKSQSVVHLRRLFTRSGKSKIPIYQESIDNVVGVAFMYDMFHKPQTIAEMCKPILYVPENKRCNELLQEFRQQNISIAIVIDEHGGTAGLITLEDLIEVLFGDFEELSDKNARDITPLNSQTWKVVGSESIETINEEINVRIPEGNYETIAGYLLAELGHIPAVGERLETDRYKIVVTNVRNNRIHEVRIIKKNE
jgi:putative hemolysin